MPLKLSVAANYKASSSVLNIRINGSYGLAVEALKVSYAFVNITLIRGIVHPGSPGKVYITAEIESKLSVGIAKNGALFQDGASPANAGGISLSKKISADKFHFGEVIVEVYNSKKSLATGRLVFKNSSR